MEESIYSKQLKKIEEFLSSINVALNKGFEIAEEERSSISGKILGFLRAVFGEKRSEDYLAYINQGTRFLDSHATFSLKSKQMINYLEIVKEEILARELFSSPEEEVSLDKLEGDVEKHKLESERRKNVAEFKYWGFAIELIDTVRQELKKFRKVQEELLDSINSLKEKLSINSQEK